MNGVGDMRITRTTMVTRHNLPHMNIGLNNVIIANVVGRIAPDHHDARQSVAHDHVVGRHGNPKPIDRLTMTDVPDAELSPHRVLQRVQKGHRPYLAVCCAPIRMRLMPVSN